MAGSEEEVPSALPADVDRVHRCAAGPSVLYVDWCVIMCRLGVTRPSEGLRSMKIEVLGQRERRRGSRPASVDRGLYPVRPHTRSEGNRLPVLASPSQPQPAQCCPSVFTTTPGTTQIKQHRYEHVRGQTTDHRDPSTSHIDIDHARGRQRAARSATTGYASQISVGVCCSALETWPPRGSWRRTTLCRSRSCLRG